MRNLRAELKQRSDYTHKFNRERGRHGWLRLTPAYSVKLVDEIVGGCEEEAAVLDPFCGTGTTALTAAYYKKKAVTVDINPFLVWFAKAKTAVYSSAVLEEASNRGREVIDSVCAGNAAPAAEPPIHNIERWWGKEARRFLRRLKGGIFQIEACDGQVADLLKVAFCRTLIDVSNAAFNHQSMSFKDSADECGQTALAFERGGSPDAFGEIFTENLNFVLAGAYDNPQGAADVVLGDSRDLSSVLDSKFDLAVTSPPYANRMSYIRELRPYMYWLDYLFNGQDAGELDWRAIGGTWGIATSRLSNWKRGRNGYFPDGLAESLEGIALSGNASGALLAKYVEKYCFDMAGHFAGLGKALNPGARVHYIVGNSTFYGNLVSTECFYADALKKFGFVEVEVIPVRKRNSKKELLEFDVSAVWP